MMATTRHPSWYALALLQLGSVLSPQFAPAATVSRAEAVRRLSEHILIPPSPEQDRSREGDGADRADAQRHRVAELIGRASHILPDQLTGHSQLALDAALQAPVVVRYDDPEYAELLVKKHLMDVKIHLAYQTMFPPVDAPTQDQLRHNIREVVEGLEMSMTRHLVDDGLFGAEEVRRHLSETRESLLASVGNPNSYFLTKPLSPAEVKEIVDDFDSRLPEGKDRVPAALAKIPKVGSPPRPSAVFEAMKRREVLDGMTVPAVRLLKKRSSDPARKHNRAEEIVPGYSGLVSQLSGVEQRLRSEEHARRVADAERALFMQSIGPEDTTLPEEYFATEKILAVDSLQSPGAASEGRSASPLRSAYNEPPKGELGVLSFPESGSRMGRVVLGLVVAAVGVVLFRYRKAFKRACRQPSGRQI